MKSPSAMGGFFMIGQRGWPLPPNNKELQLLMKVSRGIAEEVVRFGQIWRSLREFPETLMKASSKGELEI